MPDAFSVYCARSLQEQLHFHCISKIEGFGTLAGDLQMTQGRPQKRIGHREHAERKTRTNYDLRKDFRLTSTVDGLGCIGRIASRAKVHGLIFEAN
jgi:hypothetical protein